MNDVLVGPALGGIRQRRPEAWRRAWVQNLGKLAASGDEDAVKIVNHYQKPEMPRAELLDQHSSSLPDYVEANETRGTVWAAVTDGTTFAALCANLRLNSQSCYLCPSTRRPTRDRRRI